MERRAKVSNPQLELSFQPTASTNLPVIKCAISKMDPLAPLDLFQPMPYIEETNCLHLAMLKLRTQEKNKWCCCFKPLIFGVICYTAIGNWHSLTSHTPSTSFWQIYGVIWAYERSSAKHLLSGGVWIFGNLVMEYCLCRDNKSTAAR